MKTVIVFNKDNYGWTTDSKYNLSYIKHCIVHWTDLFNARGYLYLNQMYEDLRQKWNPDEINICFKRDVGPLRFDILEELNFDGNSYMIEITQ